MPGSADESFEIVVVIRAFKEVAITHTNRHLALLAHHIEPVARDAAAGGGAGRCGMSSSSKKSGRLNRAVMLRSELTVKMQVSPTGISPKGRPVVKTRFTSVRSFRDSALEGIGIAQRDVNVFGIDRQRLGVNRQGTLNADGEFFGIDHRQVARRGLILSSIYPPPRRRPALGS